MWRNDCLRHERAHIVEPPPLDGEVGDGACVLHTGRPRAQLTHHRSRGAADPHPLGRVRPDTGRGQDQDRLGSADRPESAVAQCGGAGQQRARPGIGRGRVEPVDPEARVPGQIRARQDPRPRSAPDPMMDRARRVPPALRRVPAQDARQGERVEVVHAALCDIRNSGRFGTPRAVDNSVDCTPPHGDDLAARYAIATLAARSSRMWAG
jgi:hypothetical protein